MPDLDTLMFFNSRPDVLPLYLELESLLYKMFPLVNKRVQKTQITFTNRHVFACVSFARVMRKSELPDVWLTLTLGLPEPLESSRVAVRAEPYPGRWTHHFVLTGFEDLDDELLDWIRASYAFAAGK